MFYPHNPQERGSGAKAYPIGAVGGYSMRAKPDEAAIDEIVASCDGDVMGALKALLLVNEQLEAEIRQLHAERGRSVLH